MMLFAQHDAGEVAGQIALYAAAGTAVVAVVGAVFAGVGSLLTVYFTNRGKIKADAILEYKALYDASRSEVHALRNELAASRLDLQKQAETDRITYQEKIDNARKDRDAQFAVLTAEVFKLHDEHAVCLRESGEFRVRIHILEQQIGAKPVAAITPA